MIESFGNKLAEAIYDGESTKEIRRFPPELLKQARQKLDRLDAIDQLGDLNWPPGNRFEPLKGARKGDYSIRINDQWRITFQWHAPHVTHVKIEDYHS